MLGGKSWETEAFKIMLYYTVLSYTIKFLLRNTSAKKGKSSNLEQKRTGQYVFSWKTQQDEMSIFNSKAVMALFSYNENVPMVNSYYPLQGFQSLTANRPGSITW